jgi:RNA polymerase sigma factor (sigma-70 family)
MSDDSSYSRRIQGLFLQVRSGNLQAREELFEQLLKRLKVLAERMLRRFPNVRCWVESDDVVQSAVLRLVKFLNQDNSTTVNSFLQLAACHLRRELLDLARQVKSRHAHQHRSLNQREGDSEGQNSYPLAQTEEDLEDLDRWCCFHEAVEHLPTTEREVVGLIFYHGWKQAEVAEFLQLSERTVRRLWRSALNKLGQDLRETE